MLLAGWAHILPHAAGHLPGGLCSGCRFVSYRAAEPSGCAGQADRRAAGMRPRALAARVSRKRRNTADACAAETPGV